MSWSERQPNRHCGIGVGFVSFTLLLAPTSILGCLGLRLDSLPLLVGAGVQALFVFVFFRSFPIWRPPASSSVIILYLIALGWLYLPTRDSTDWAVHVGQGVLLMAAVGLVAIHDLTRTGAEPLRLANKWSRRITGRTHWPMQIIECRSLPEVHRLKEAIREDARPALALLTDPRPEVVTAALGAMEYRPRWRPGEAELVLKVARRATDPGLRVAAAYALASVESAELISGLAAFLRDPSAEVRHAAAEALLWEGDRRWGFARDAVREALADPKMASDGPLFTGTMRLPVAAIADLTTWAADHPPLARRAIVTLIEQHNRGLLDAERPELSSELAGQMFDPETPPALRVELAALLRDHRHLSPDLLDRLTNPDQPGPMRLFAAEVMLLANPNDPDGVDVMRGLARQPNRELAIQIGAILQRVLGLNVGLPLTGELPAPNSKLAADVSRKVLGWANGVAPEQLRPKGGTQSGHKPASKPPFAGLQQTNVIPQPQVGSSPGRGSSAVF